MEHIKLQRKWLLLAISVLLLAGLLTFIIVFSRTPIIKDFFIFKSFFARALIVHVDLSQLFWPLIIGVFLTAIKYNNFHINVFFYIALFAALLIFFSPFFTSGKAILNNYIPIIDNLPFTLAIALFMTVVFLFSCHYVICHKVFFSDDYKESFLYAYHIIILISCINYLASIKLSNNITETTIYYEIIFWSFGHLLQFAYVTLMVLCWLILLKAANCRVIFSNNALQIILFLYLTIATLSLAIYAFPHIDLYDFKNYFTQHMIYGSSFLAIIIAVGLLYSFFDKNFYYNSAENRILLNSFLGSFLLFFYGGFLGAKISGNNTIIPAHYHGQAVGVTIALIGIVYYYLPKCGYKPIKSKLAIWQPILYAFGQFIHISGLAISGGYGALRKAPDSIYGFNAKFWMGIMGIGGLITLIAGIMFFIICYQSIRNNKKLKY